jgi:hypothetical protein
VAIQRPAKENSKKNSGGFKDLLKEKCPWHLNGNHTTEECYQLRHARKGTPEPLHPHDKKGKKKNDGDNNDFQEPDKTVNVLFGGLPSKREQKATRREVMSIEPAVPTPLRWSEVPINFSLADFETSYHAILGRPAIAKFMVVPHYTYLVLKMPSPAGVLPLQGDLKISHDCDTEAVEIASTNQVPNAMMEVYAASKKLATSELDIPEKSDNANKPQPAEEVLVKTIDLGTGDSSKTTTIGAGLDPK